VIAAAEFVHDPSDFVALNRLHLRRGAARALGTLLCAALFGLVFGAAAFTTQGPGRALWPIPAAAVLGSALGWLLARLFRGFGERSASRLTALIAFWAAKRDGLLISQQLTLTPEGLRATSCKGETFTRWAGIQEIVRHDDVLFFFVSRRMAFMVPRRAFTMARDFAEFEARATELHNASAIGGENPG